MPRLPFLLLQSQPITQRHQLIYRVGRIGELVELIKEDLERHSANSVSMGRAYVTHGFDGPFAVVENEKFLRARLC